MAILTSDSSRLMLGSLMVLIRDIVDVLTLRTLSSAILSLSSPSITLSMCVKSTLRGSRCSDFELWGAFFVRVLVLEILHIITVPLDVRVGTSTL